MVRDSVCARGQQRSREPRRLASRPRRRKLKSSVERREFLLLCSPGASRTIYTGAEPKSGAISGVTMTLCRRRAVNTV
nr:unnamed protein product [Callosobruchus chinensis]